MRDAESVTFGGSGLERAAQWRGDAAKIAELLAEGGVLPFWRGKPLLDAQTRLPMFLAADHPVFSVSDTPPIFLGIDEGAPRFARDISAWEPEEDTDTVGDFVDSSEQTHPAIGEKAGFADIRANLAVFTPRSGELVASAKALFEWHSTHQFCAKCGEKSEMSDAGWQRTCPVCNARHFPRTDPVVIMLIKRGNSVLMGRSPHWPEAMYSLLAGFVEPGESIEGAVRRETYEEAGISVGPVRYLASQPWPFPNSLMFGCEGIATSEEITLDPVELDDAKWVTREEMMAATADQLPEMKPARKGSIARFLIEKWLADALD